MKKFLTVALVMGLVLAVAGPSMAMHFEMNGDLRVRSFYFNNYLADGETSEFVDQRFRVGMTWGLTENVFLKARADLNEGFWGDRTGSLGENPAVDPDSGLVDPGDFFETTSKSAIAFDQLYGQFTFPNAPVTVVVGRQGVKWGLGTAASGDNRDRLKIVAKTSAATLVFAYDKFRENFVANLANNSIQDSHGFAAAVVAPVGPAKAGLLYYYLSNKSNADVQHNLIDGFFDGQFGPLNAKADVGYRFGKNHATGSDIEGFSAYAAAFFNAGMANLGLEFAYNQGDDPNTAKTEGALPMDYHGPFNSIVLYNNLDYDGFATNKGADVGVNNAIALKASATASPSEKVSLTGAVVWAQLDQVAAGMSDALGVEVDGILSYSIYDNVTYTLGLGYLFAGDAFGSVGDPFAMMNALNIKF